MKKAITGPAAARDGAMFAVLAVAFSVACDHRPPTATLMLAAARPLVNAQQYEFLPVWTTVEGNLAHDLAFGDVDGDGDLDMAIGNAGLINRLYENLGSTYPTTASWVSSEADTTLGVAFGDLNGDGDLDLVVGNATQSNRMYENTGTALTPVASWSSTDLDETYCVALGDADGDGDLDMAVGNYALQNNRLYVNSGSGLSTTSGWSSTEAEDTHGIAFGDVDGDGTLDLAVGNHNLQANQLYSNSGVGIGATSGWTSTEMEPSTDVAFGDVDADGDLDLAVANAQYSIFTSKNRIYSSDGTALESTASWSSLERDESFSVAFGDADGDGDLDLAVGNYEFQSNRMHDNSGTGLETVAFWSSAHTDSSYRAALGDVDEDGDLDLAVGNSGFHPERVYENTGRALTASALWSSADANTSRELAFGDVDADGDLDLGVANTGSQTNRLHANTGTGLSPTAFWASADATDTSGAAFGDVDGDGDLDFGVSNTNGLAKLYENTGTTLAPNPIWSGQYKGFQYSVGFMDEDSDGDLDLLIGMLGSDEFYRNTGTALDSVSLPLGGDSDATARIAFVDVDNDGDLDFAAAKFADSRNRIYQNTGSAISTLTWWLSANGLKTSQMAFGDIDGDGDLDMAEANNALGSSGLYRNAGNGLEVTPFWSAAAIQQTNAAAFGDMDGDGDLDLVLASHGAANLGYINTASGFDSLATWATEETDDTQSIAFADVDGDGDLDLAFANMRQNNRLHRKVGHNSFASTHAPGASIAAPGSIGNIDGGPAATLLHASSVLMGSPITVPFVLRDVESRKISRVELDYSYGLSPLWRPGTLIGATGNLNSSPTGTAHTVSWDIASDEVYGDDVRIRLRLIGQQRLGLPYPWQRGSAALYSTTYRIKTDPGADLDGDGFRGFLDCDDSLAACTIDCSDADQDGTPDCNDLCIDIDNDGYGVPGASGCIAGPATDCNDLAADVHPGMTDVTCDGVDDDCDGFLDEDYVSETACGSGACRLTSTASNCSVGVELPCLPGSPSESLEVSCGDLIDNDCDGLIDSADDSCATGPCLDGDGDGFGAPGSVTCPQGAAVDCDDADASISPDAGDTICNGVDNDCNGAVDDGYVPNSNCGYGHCLVSNIPSSCVAGTEIPCIPGAPLDTIDTTCDGVDDDCDGPSDEDYLVDSDCGAGICQLSNTPSKCASGQETVCRVGLPTQLPEASCNDGIDNDCDGAADSFDTDCAGTCVDSDSDTVCDGADNCPALANTDQRDTDGDGEGDTCDTDDDGDTTPDTQDPCPLVATMGPPTSPIAYAGPDVSVAEFAVTIIDGSASCIVSGAATYAWSQVGGPSVELGNANIAKLIFAAPRVVANTTLTFELTVGDSTLQSDGDTVIVTVTNTMNEAPIADAGPDQIAHSGDMVVLTGSDSSDPNGDTLAISWSQLAGPTVALSNAQLLDAQFEAPHIAVSQDLVLELVVIDPHGATAVDSVVVKVLPITGAPVFVSTPRLQGTAGAAYRYDDNYAIEVAGEPTITIAASLAPSGFEIDSEGNLTWVPEAAGLMEVALSATNELGSAEQRYTVEVFAAPVIVSTPSASFFMGIPYAYDADGIAEALGSSPISWKLTVAPPEMFIHEFTGRLLWTPTDASAVSVTISATNAHGSNEQSFGISRNAAGPPVITPSANPKGTVGAAYRYDADKHVDVVDVLPEEPLRVELLDGPEGFIVHPITREVGFVPVQVGAHPVSLGLFTPAGVLVHNYDFDIEVTAEGSVKLEAIAAATPVAGVGPLPVVFDGSESHGTEGVGILQYVWDTQTGPILRTPDPVISYEYDRPGGYNAILEIWDALGFFDSDNVVISVMDGPNWPPTAVIEADNIEGEGGMTVRFDCQCSDPDGSITSVFWTFGDGASSSSASPEHRYDRIGSYTVRLVAEDDQGLLAHDNVTITVRGETLLPPTARIQTTSIDPNGPLTLELQADVTDRDGVVSLIQWTLPDGTRVFEPSVVVSIREGQYYDVRLEAVDNDGLSGYDERTIIVRKNEKRPPRIVSAPVAVASAGVPYSYDNDSLPSVQGERPVFWSLGRASDTGMANIPSGMVVDVQTGEISWTPAPGQLGEHRVTLRVDNEAGTYFQDYLLTVNGTALAADIQPGANASAAGCGCRSSREGSAWLLALVLLLTSIVRSRRLRKVGPGGVLS